MSFLSHLNESHIPHFPASASSHVTLFLRFKLSCLDIHMVILYDTSEAFTFLTWTHRSLQYLLGNILINITIPETQNAHEVFNISASVGRAMEKVPNFQYLCIMWKSWKRFLTSYDKLNRVKSILHLCLQNFSHDKTHNREHSEEDYSLMNMKHTKMIIIQIQKLQARLLYSDRREASTLRLSWLESATLDALSTFCPNHALLENQTEQNVFEDCQAPFLTHCLHEFLMWKTRAVCSSM